MHIFYDFDEDVVISIRKHLQAHITADSLEDCFPINSCLREDVFEVLNRYCTVIYYPIEDQSNRGFHIREYLSHNGNEKDFVFINTSQTLEKQVFTAAHELGHIWKIDELVLQDVPGVNRELSEAIINRFAAELLMPENSFRAAVAVDVRQLDKKEVGNMIQVDLRDMLKIVVKRMDQFRAPSGAVIRRLFELHIIPKDTMNILLGGGHIAKEKIDDEVGRIIRENDYSSLRNPTKRKFIPGLAELLDKAAATHCVASSKINELRKKFELPQNEISPEWDLNVTIETEGATENDIHA